MKLGWNLETGLNRYLTSWKSVDDPTRGDYTASIDPRGLSQLVVYKGPTLYFRAGSWNGQSFTGAPEVIPNSVFIPVFVTTKKEMYYSYKRDGLEGFTPKSIEDWKQLDWSGGCTRRRNFSCQNGDGFKMFPNMKLPDSSESWVNKSMNLEECKVKCFRTCSCVAYSNMNNTDTSSGCVMWFGDLIDMRQYSFNGQDLYVRMAASELGYTEKNTKSGKKKRKIGLIVISIIIGMVLWSGVISLTQEEKKEAHHISLFVQLLIQIPV